MDRNEPHVFCCDFLGWSIHQQRDKFFATPTAMKFTGPEIEGESIGELKRVISEADLIESATI